MYVYSVDNYMKNLISDCIKKCKAVNIPISDQIIFSTMAGERIYGQCISVRNSGCFRIEISKYLVNESEIVNTIFHELLHTCPDCSGHDRQWQAYGKLIEKYYGQNITRVGNKQIKADIRSSKRRYFTKEEYENNKDILVALAVEGDDKPSWFVKRNSSIVKHLDRCSSRQTGKKIIIFNK